MITEPEIEIKIFQQRYYDDLKDMIFSLYSEDSYSEMISGEKIAQTIAVLTNNPDEGVIYIFTRDGQVTGYAIIIFYWSNEYGSYIVWLDELYVKPEFRQQGIATRFIDYISTQPPKRARAIMLEVTKGNERAKSVYIKKGFVLQKNLWMVKKLG